jgi:hypothetical protein
MPPCWVYSNRGRVVWPQVGVVITCLTHLNLQKLWQNPSPTVKNPFVSLSKIGMEASTILKQHNFFV